MRRGLSLLVVLVSALGLGLTEVRAQAAVPQAEPPPITREAALDLLFTRLAASRQPAEAAVLRDEIWAVWLHSGSPSIDLLMDRAVDALESGQLHHCLELLNRMVVLAPDFAEAWNKRATVLYYLGEPERSLADIARTLELEPRHFGALSGMAMIFDDQGERAKAAVVRAQVRALTPLLP